MSRPTRALVDLTALRHNCQIARSLSGNGRLMAVVKANAYGHGAVRAAAALEALVDAFAVACIEEAEELRSSGITLPIMLMEGIFSPDELDLAARDNFWVMVQNPEQLDILDAANLPTPVTCWLKLDSGMHRLGFPLEQTGEVVERLRHCAAAAEDIVLATHLACADDLDNDFTREQIRRVREQTSALDLPLSLANSPGLLGWPEARAEWNRAGVMLYGQSPFHGSHPEGDRLKPVMTLISRIIALREVAVGEAVGYGGTWVAERPSVIATVPVGYGDGYPRRAGNGTPVSIRGQRAPLAGRVSMDMVTVDVTHLGDVALGDEVILWGADPTANEVADCAETIGYEIMTRLLPRVPREYAD